MFVQHVERINQCIFALRSFYNHRECRLPSPCRTHHHRHRPQFGNTCMGYNGRQRIPRTLPQSGYDHLDNGCKHKQPANPHRLVIGKQLRMAGARGLCQYDRNFCVQQLVGICVFHHDSCNGLQYTYRFNGRQHHEYIGPYQLAGGARGIRISAQLPCCGQCHLDLGGGQRERAGP